MSRARAGERALAGGKTFSVHISPPSSLDIAFHARDAREPRCGAALAFGNFENSLEARALASTKLDFSRERAWVRANARERAVKVYLKQNSRPRRSRHPSSRVGTGAKNRTNPTTSMRLAGTTTEEVSSTSTRVLKEEEERVISELFESTRHATTEGISSLDRILKLELEDADRALSDALESSGSAMASLSAYVSEVERSIEDVNAWSTVFETKLVNMRRNIEIIKGRDDKRDVSNENKRALAAAVRGLLGELELPVGVERAVREHSLDDERGILTIYDALRRLLDFKRKLRYVERDVSTSHAETNSVSRRDGLPVGIATMRVTLEAREQVDVIAMHAFERVFERLRAITEVRIVLLVGINLLIFLTGMGAMGDAKKRDERREHVGSNTQVRCMT